MEWIYDISVPITPKEMIKNTICTVLCPVFVSNLPIKESLY